MFDIVLPLAAAQQGAFSTAQVTDRGGTRSWLSRHRVSGTLVRRAPGVYALASAPDTVRQQLMVHLLRAGEGALATADSALGLWCDELVLPQRHVIVVPRSCGYRAGGVEVRRSSDLHLANPGRVGGIPVVGVARALLDASRGRTPDEVVALIDACRRGSSLAVGALIEVLETHERAGRPGIVTFREALRSLWRTVTDSEFERLVIRDLVALGVPAPRVHHVVRLPGEDPVELDLDWPGCDLDVELDGRDHVERARQARRDRQRDRLLQAAGWVVPRYTWDDYVSDRQGMQPEIAAFVERRRDGLTRRADETG